MTKGGKFKDKVRARAVRTGTSYSTARLHEHGERGGAAGAPDSSSFEAIVRRVILLAKARDDEHDADPRNHGVLDTSYVIEQVKERRLGRRPPAKAALYDFISKLSEEQVRKLRALHVAGDHDDDVHLMHRLVSKEKHFVNVSKLAGHTYLAPGLEKGLALAQKEAVDLEGDFSERSAVSLNVDDG